MKIGRCVFVLCEKERKFIVKKEPPCPNIIWRIILRKITGISLPYENELLINRELKSSRFYSLRFPIMLGVDDEGSMRFEYLDGFESRDFSPEILERLLDGLFEFNTSCITVHKKLINSLLFSFHESPLISSLFMLKKSSLASFRKGKLALIVIWHCLTNKNKKDVLLHNDLVISNVFILKKEYQAILIDFEDVILNSNFVLADCVDILFNSDELSLDMKKVRDFSNRLMLFGVRIKSDYERDQLVRICLIRHCVKKLISSKISIEDKSKIRVFLESVLSKNDKYRCWILEQSK